MTSAPEADSGRLIVECVCGEAVDAPATGIGPYIVAEFRKLHRGHTPATPAHARPGPQGDTP